MNWPTLAGAVFGCGAVVGVLLGLFNWQERRRRARKERPPLKNKLLRPAGYSAMCQVLDLADKLMPALAFALITDMGTCLGFPGAMIVAR